MKLKYNELSAQLPITNSKYFDIYVSIDGNDSNPGTIDKPVRTLNRALHIVTYCLSNYDVKIMFLSDYTDSNLISIRNIIPYVIIDSNGFNVTLYRVNVFSVVEFRNINFKCGYDRVVSGYYNSVIRFKGTTRFIIEADENTTSNVGIYCVYAQGGTIIVNYTDDTMPTTFEIDTLNTSASKNVYCFALFRNSMLSHEYYSKNAWDIHLNGNAEILFYAAQSTVLTLDKLNLTVNNGAINKYYDIKLNSFIELGVLKDKNGLIDATSSSAN